MGQVVETGTKVCPYCSERVRAEAVKCRFCGEWFQDRTQPETAADRQSPAVEDHDARPRPEAHTSGRAIASFLFALLGGGLGAIPAVVLGRQARQEIRKSEGRIKGDGWAYWGLVLGGVQLAVLGVVALVLLINTASKPGAPPPSPDGPLRVQRVSGPVDAYTVVAEKRGDTVYVTFTLKADVTRCFISVNGPAGGRGFWTDSLDTGLDAGLHTESFRASYATRGPVNIACG